MWNELLIHFRSCIGRMWLFKQINIRIHFKYITKTKHYICIFAYQNIIDIIYSYQQLSPGWLLRNDGHKNELHSLIYLCGLPYDFPRIITFPLGKCWQVYNYYDIHKCMVGLIWNTWRRSLIWRHRSGSTLALVMAWCLTAHSIEPRLTWHQWGFAAFTGGQNT